MLIVKDLNRLPAYGFEKQAHKNNAGHDMYIKDVYCGGNGDEVLFSVIVNPYRMSSEPDVENEAICNVYSEREGSFEHAFPMDLAREAKENGIGGQEISLIISHKFGKKSSQDLTLNECCELKTNWIKYWQEYCSSQADADDDKKLMEGIA